jgi:hypothetical protein
MHTHIYSYIYRERELENIIIIMGLFEGDMGLWERKIE